MANLYRKFITFQYLFLNDVFYGIPKDNNEIFERNKRFEYLKNIIKHEIQSQKANKCNILHFDITTDDYGSFS